MAAIILAGGASRRMGTPKALLDWQGEPFLDRLTGVFRSCGVAVYAVLGHEAERIASQLRRIDQATYILNPMPQRGQTSSLQCALRALPPDLDGFFFLPVDIPAVQANTIEQLIVRWSRRSADTLLLVPRYRDGQHERRGHPVLTAMPMRDRFLDLPEGQTARDVIHSHRSHTEYLDVDDSGILIDVDTPEAYAELKAAAPPAPLAASPGAMPNAEEDLA